MPIDLVAFGPIAEVLPPCSEPGVQGEVTGPESATFGEVLGALTGERRQAPREGDSEPPKVATETRDESAPETVAYALPAAQTPPVPPAVDEPGHSDSPPPPEAEVGEPSSALEVPAVVEQELGQALPAAAVEEHEPLTLELPRVARELNPDRLSRDTVRMPVAGLEHLLEAVTSEAQAPEEGPPATPLSAMIGRFLASADSGDATPQEGGKREPSHRPTAFVSLGGGQPAGPVNSVPIQPVSLPGGGDAVGAPAPESVPGQVIKAIALQWRHGVGEARIQLRPEHLGHVTVSLRVEAGSVTAVVRAENQGVGDQILAHQHQLRTALEQQGLMLGRLVVAADPDARRPPRHPWRDTGVGRARRPPLATAPLFEIEV